MQKKTDDIKKKEEKTAQEQINQPLDLDIGGFMFPGMNPGMSMPALMAPPGMMPNMNMGGFGTNFGNGGQW